MQGNGVCEDGSGSVDREGEGHFMVAYEAFVLLINNDHELNHSRLLVLSDIVKIVKKSPPGKDIKKRCVVLL